MWSRMIGLQPSRQDEVVLPRRAKRSSYTRFFKHMPQAFKRPRSRCTARKKKFNSCAWICCGGRACTRNLRFVLVLHHGEPSILVSIDLTLEAAEIIRLYGYQVQDRMHVSGNEAGDRRLQLPLLE